MRFIARAAGLLCMALLPVACGENYALHEETFTFSEKHKGWMPADSLGQSFVMQDAFGISQSFTLRDSSHYFSKSWSAFLAVTTDISHTEYSYYSYRSSFGMGFSISLTAGWPPYGDHLTVYMGETGFLYDLDLKQVSRIDTPFGSISCVMTSEGFEGTEDILSVVEHLDDFEWGGRVYEEILHFELRDFQEQWTDYTVTDVYLAKGVGLVGWISRLMTSKRLVNDDLHSASAAAEAGIDHVVVN